MYCKVVQLVDIVELDEVNWWGNLILKTSSFKNLISYLEPSSYMFITYLGRPVGLFVVAFILAI